MLDSGPSLAFLLFLAAAHLAGVATAVVALMSSRTPQGTVAWILSLVFAPWAAVPLYWLFGRSRFEGYASARQGGDAHLRQALGPVLASLEAHRVQLPEPRGGIMAAESLAHLPLVGGNRVEPLVDGVETFRSLFAGIERAERSLVIQFYILRDDDLGQDLKTRLLACARRGVRVLVLVDKIGSQSLPEAYLDELREAGIEVRAFNRPSVRDPFGLLQRDHRKLVVVDGEVAFLGGFCIGEEWVGTATAPPWRDTGVEIRGPGAAAAVILPALLPELGRIAGVDCAPPPPPPPPPGRDLSIR